MRPISTIWQYLALCFIIVSPSLAQVQFTESATTLGCGNSSYGTGTLGGGISFFDFDQDGWDDITVASEEGSPIRFFKNNLGFFSEVDLGIDNSFELKTVQWVDFDNDGDYDFFATSNIDQNKLYENDGSMNFTDITVEAGLYMEAHWSYGSSWGDFNNDGWLDVFIASHYELDEGYYNVLFRNNGDGTFTDVSVQAGIFQASFISFCSAFFDYDKDGWQDIYVANDRAPVNQLYHNNGDGTFTEVGASSGTGISIDAMSTTIDDHNNDGWLDIYVTNTGAGNAFLENNGDGTFTDLAHTNGTLMESVAWGAVFLDGDNGGIKDLYVSAMVDDPNVALTAAYYEDDGSGLYFIPSNAGLYEDHAVSFGNAIGDITNNGYPDISVLNFSPNDMFLFKNEGTSGNNWLKVALEGTQSNRQGIGSWIEISVDGEKQYNYTLCGEGYLGQNSAYEFFGIGTASNIDYVKVTWLSGIVDIVENPEINTMMTIVEGSTLGLSNFDKSTALIYPNPSEGFMTIEVSQQFIGRPMTILDASGRIVKTMVLSSKKQIITTNDLSAGIYFIRLGNKTAIITEKLVIK
ncbi:MAG: FG-GAP-like repeat-containing protein [Bacteroidetes bacterium]|nr:FG-GAP-like repeat-containing protein [Bacteroidota bacterium]